MRNFTFCWHDSFLNILIFGQQYTNQIGQTRCKELLPNSGSYTLSFSIITKYNYLVYYYFDLSVTRMMRSYKIRSDNEDKHVVETDIIIFTEEGITLNSTLCVRTWLLCFQSTSHILKSGSPLTWQVVLPKCSHLFKLPLLTAQKILYTKVNYL